MSKFGTDLTVGNIPRHLFLFALPLLAGNFIQAAYTFVNRFWVGRYLGADDIAAVTTTMQLAFILIAVANGVTIAANILISQFVGAKNWAGVHRVVQSSVLVVGLLSLVLLGIGQLVTVPLLHAINTQPTVFPLAEGYMRLFVCTFPLIFLGFLFSFMLRGVGDSVTPLIFQSVGVAINAALDPLFMLGWLGFPKCGLNGTIYATWIAQSITLIAFLSYLHYKKHPISPDWRHLRADWATSKLMLTIGLPAATQQLLVSVGASMMLLFINNYGKDATAGFGAASMIDMIAFFIAMSFSMAISSIAGQNIGAKRFDRVKQIFWWGILYSGVLIGIVSLIALSFPEQLMNIFIDRAKEANIPAHDIGVGYLKIVGWSYICFAVMFVCVGIINGAGHTMVTTIMTLFGLWIVRIPLAWYLSNKYHDVRTIWVALAFGFFVSMSLTLSYYLSGMWRKSLFKPKGPPIRLPEADAATECIVAGEVCDGE